MRIIHEGRTYIISWNHIRESAEIESLCSKTNYSAVTVCNVIPTTGGEASEQGLAFCLKEDFFNKEIGRKISLKRALKVYTKKFRTFVWKAYFARKNAS